MSKISSNAVLSKEEQEAEENKKLEFELNRYESVEEETKLVNGLLHELLKSHPRNESFLKKAEILHIRNNQLQDDLERVHRELIMTYLD